ncbi:MAG TPA: hypothetical protein VKR99_07865 [Candidatus Eremiobacteraceae bacterium]|nr:hypothetical protein [Candidatus Eremiobacteraceae bacterium]
MERLRLERGCFRKASGEPAYLLGANYWPRLHGPWMYREPWDPDEVSAEFQQLAALGCNVVRVFCFTPDFLPTPEAVRPEAQERLGSMIALAAEHGLWSIPTFLVGHMSGENWEPDWCAGRNWCSEETILRASELLVRTIAKQFAGDARIAAWLLTNEWPLFSSASHADTLAWATRLCAAARAVDPASALSLGDGAWDIIGGQRAALPAKALTTLVDFFGPHFYPKETDAIRHSVFASFAMRMSQTFAKPVLLEEFGCSSDQAADGFAADYYRTTLWSAFGAGNCGTLFWNSHDFPLADRRPYSHHPYELHFGVIRTDGSLKPQAAEVARFARFVGRHALDGWQPASPRAAIGRCEYYFEDFPFDWGWSKPQLRDLYLQAYACAAMGGLDTGFVDLAAGIPSHCRLLFVPCLQQVTTADTARLEEFVRNGGAVYLSYGGEPWFPDLGAFIGAQPQIRYGLTESPQRETRVLEQLSLRFVDDWGDLAKGSVIQMPLAGADRRSAPLRCEPVEASVLAVDETGNPALFLRQFGSGHVVFMAYPLEYLALRGFDSNARNGTFKLYRALAENFGALPPLRAKHPCVQSFTWSSRGDERLHRLLVINHTWNDVTTSLSGDLSELRDVESGEPDEPDAIKLPPKGVRVFDVRL